MVNVKLRLTVLLGASLAVICAMLGLVFSSAANAASPTGSQTPPVTLINTECSVAETLTLPANSSAAVSGSLTEPCPFASGSTTTEKYNGTTLESKVAPTTGLITLATSAHDPVLSIDGGPYLPAVFGVNTVIATGVNSTGGTNTATFLIDITQLSNSTNGSTGGTSGGSTGTGSTGTGTVGTVVNKTPAVGLAFTGANLAALIAAALFLLIMGAAIVIYTRRKALERQLEFAVDHPDRRKPLAISDEPDSTWRMNNIW